ncbi:hypothetical protein TSAR_004548, partial [Trichomalopsis sarcophagae]
MNVERIEKRQEDVTSEVVDRTRPTERAHIQSLITPPEERTSKKTALIFLKSISSNISLIMSEFPENGHQAGPAENQVDDQAGMMGDDEIEREMANLA